MMLQGEIPGKPRTFEEILEVIRSPAYRVVFPRILKTARVHGFLTEGTLVTRLRSGEKSAIDKMDRLAVDAIDGYAEADPLPMGEAAPRFLGPRVETAKYAGAGVRYKMVLLSGEGREMLVEVQNLLTLLRRHPGAEWRFAKGREYRSRPVVVLERDGMCRGEFLASLSPVDVDSWVCDPPPPFFGGLELIEGPVLRYSRR